MRRIYSALIPKAVPRPWQRPPILMNTHHRPYCAGLTSADGALVGLRNEYNKIRVTLDAMERELNVMNAAKYKNPNPHSTDEYFITYYDRFKNMEPAQQQRCIDDHQGAVRELRQRVDKIVDVFILGKSTITEGSSDVALESFFEALCQRKFEDAKVVLKSYVARLVQEEGEAMTDTAPCFPEMVKKTWGFQEWWATLVAAEKNTHGSGTRDPLILGVVAGMGFGKTHSILCCEEEVKKEHGTFVYLTYTMDQQLLLDKVEATARVAILMRVLLRTLGCSNRGCDYIFSSASSTVSRFRSPDVQTLLIELLSDHFATCPHVFIGVDEIRTLDNDAAIKTVTSILGHLVKGIRGANSAGKKCTVLVTSLRDATFTTYSSRTIYTVSLVKPHQNTPDMVDFVVQQMLPGANAEQKAWIAAIGGSHFRSVTVACQVLKDAGAEPIPLRLFVERVMGRIGAKMNGDDIQRVRDFVTGCVSLGPSKAATSTGAAQSFISENNAVPPCLVWYAFEGQDNMTSNAHPAQCIFQTSSHTPATKRLERIGYEYDRFRALCDCPVVPKGVRVHNGDQLGIEWIQSLRFSQNIAFKAPETRSIIVNGTLAPWFASSEYRVLRAVYMFPENANHPWIDRACVAYHPVDKTHCLVLFQDKINAAMKEAADSLSKAADLISKHRDINVLCVANLLSNQDKDNMDTEGGLAGLQYPHVLIRAKDIEKFYTPTFAPAVAYAWTCHTVSQPFK